MVSWFADDMRRRLRLVGMSQAQLAAAVHVTPSYLSLIINGRRAPGPKLAGLVDAALRADGELAALVVEPAAVLSPRVEPLGEIIAESTRATTRHLVALDTAHGSDGLVDFATRAFRTVADRLAVVGGAADVRVAVADLGAVAAWITADAVRREQSRAIALEALALADLVGDNRMHRFLLSHLSMVSEHAGRYADAVAYADRALAEEPDNPRVRAMFEVRRARGLSGLGASTEALAAWDRAESLLTESPSADDGLTYWIHDSEMAIHRAVILSRGGDRGAVDWSHRGIEQLPATQGRDQVLFRAMALSHAVTAHAWRDVPGIVDELVQFGGVGRSARVPETLQATWEGLTRQRVPSAARDAVCAARQELGAQGGPSPSADGFRATDGP